MARKTKEDAEKTRIALLESALNIFDDKGYSNTTLTDIATSAGMTRGAVYWHFKDKKDLFLQMTQWMLEEEEKIIEKPGNGYDVEDVSEIIDVIVAYFQALAQNKHLEKFFRVTTYKVEYTQELSDILQSQRHGIKESLTYLTDAFSSLSSKGKLKVGLDPAKCAALIITHAWGIIALWILDKTMVDLATDGYGFLKPHIENMTP